MECSPNVDASKRLFLVVEKQILRDIAEGILNEVVELVDLALTPDDKKSLQYITKYATTLAKLTE